MHERFAGLTVAAQADPKGHLPKDNGPSRPIGISSTEDKIVLEALRELLEVVYEPIFHDYQRAGPPWYHPVACRDLLRFLGKKLSVDR